MVVPEKRKPDQDPVFVGRVRARMLPLNAETAAPGILVLLGRLLFRLFGCRSGFVLGECSRRRLFRRRSCRGGFSSSRFCRHVIFHYDAAGGRVEAEAPTAGRSRGGGRSRF